MTVFPAVCAQGLPLAPALLHKLRTGHCHLQELNGTRAHLERLSFRQQQCAPG